MDLSAFCGTFWAETLYTKILMPENNHQRRPANRPANKPYTVLYFDPYRSKPTTFDLSDSTLREITVTATVSGIHASDLTEGGPGWVPSKNTFDMLVEQLPETLLTTPRLPYPEPAQE